MPFLTRLVTLTCLVLALGSVPGTSQGIGRNCVQRGPHVDCSSFTDTFSSTANTININLQDSIPRRESSPHWDSAPRCFTYPDGFNRCDRYGWHAGAVRRQELRERLANDIDFLLDRGERYYY